MNRTLPPEMVLEKQPAKIVFQNRFDYRSNPGIKDKHEAAYKISIDEFANTLAKIKPSEDKKVIFNIDTTRMNSGANPEDDSTAIMHEIRALCKTTNSDFYLSLDSLYLYFDWEVIRDEDEDGSVSKTKEFYLMGDYYLTLFNVEGRIRNRTVIEKSIYFKSRPTLGSLITFQPNLDNAKKKLTNIAEEAAIEYVGLFYPSIEKDIPRQLHASKIFKETNALIKGQKYNEAIRKLQKMTKTLNPKLAAKAQENLDVVIELRDNNIRKSLNHIDLE